MSVGVKRVGMVKLPLTEGKNKPKQSMRRTMMMAIVAFFPSWDLFNSYTKIKVLWSIRNGLGDGLQDR